jgi:hypothetical protein
MSVLVYVLPTVAVFWHGSPKPRATPRINCGPQCATTRTDLTLASWAPPGSMSLSTR